MCRTLPCSADILVASFFITFDGPSFLGFSLPIWGVLSTANLGTVVLLRARFIRLGKESLLERLSNIAWGFSESLPDNKYPDNPINATRLRQRVSMCSLPCWGFCLFVVSSSSSVTFRFLIPIGDDATSSSLRSSSPEIVAWSAPEPEDPSTPIEMGK